MNKNPKRPPIVEIKWIDSISGNGWFSEEQATEWFNSKCFLWSTGYLINKSNGYYTIVPAWNSDGRFSSPFSIPKKAVDNIRYIRR